MNKSSVLTTVHEQSKVALLSTSFVMVAEIHNVDVPGPSNRDAAELSPTSGTLCSGPCATVVGLGT